MNEKDIMREMRKAHQAELKKILASKETPVKEDFEQLFQEQDERHLEFMKKKREVENETK